MANYPLIVPVTPFLSGAPVDCVLERLCHPGEQTGCHKSYVPW